ncbi:serine/threonine-protein kinase [Actinomadura fulvescens]|uniref:non-specific serine/threonine protein kinase n=1 Tax=Actinomadura fulvescens TaxID=46160 RepID=A0ABN3PLC4_9ACTN
MDPTAEPYPIPGEPPLRLSRYRLVRLISESPLSSVYLAEEAGLGRRVVLKILGRQFAEEKSFRERFQREMVAAAQMDHPNIVPIYASGEVDGRLYLVLRYVSGGDLGGLLAAGPGRLDLDRTIDVVIQVAAALDAAHAAGLVHRDVKPGNILVDTLSGHVYLTDFGIVKVTSAETVTATGRFLGTAAYAAPEQIKSEPVDRRTDVYALGCVVYQCLTGEKAFGGGEVPSVLWGHLNEPPPRVTPLRPDLDPRIDAIIAKAMAKRPEDRYATCGRLAAALAELGAVRDKGHGARRDLLRAPITDQGSPPGTSRRPARWGPSLKRRRRPLLIGAGVVLVAAVAAYGLEEIPDDGRSPAAGASRSPSAVRSPAALGGGQSGAPLQQGHTVIVHDKPGNSPQRGVWKRVTKAPPTKNRRTACSQHDPSGTRLCVSTGVRVPTTVWFENETPLTFPIRVAVLGTKFDVPLWGRQAISRPRTIEGAQWDGFSNDCFWGLVYFPDGKWGAQTHARVCVV